MPGLSWPIQLGTKLPGSHCKKSRVDYVFSTARFQYFSCGIEPSKRTSCWHAVRVHHRTRLLRGSEASCERFGSLLHQGWSDQEEASPAVAVSKAHLLSAHVRCLGSDRDTVLVHQVEKLLEDSHVNPLRKNSFEAAQMQEHQQVLEESGRMPEIDREFKSMLDLGLADCPGSSHDRRKMCAEHRASSLPTTLPPELMAVVESSAVDGTYCSFFMCWSSSMKICLFT